MLVRIVCMTFREDYVAEFISIFNERKHLIAAFAGCSGVSLLRDTLHPSRFFTISRWSSAEDLENYRNSALFQDTWAMVKPFFSEKPMAWSLEEC
ncbi:MAG: antibiotic biosynthesis monooxygenase [Chitinophagales bacterium]|nr:antibiotic biosynthesis monooxygenase [Chitinophagales bacterium]MDW8419572.1 antibiotic biosynthesis monooxygenase family protein [Chitinophagales bacterium]